MKKKKELTTECSKCGGEPTMPKCNDRFDDVFKLTGFRCQKCGHWNDYTKRKFYNDTFRKNKNIS